MVIRKKREKVRGKYKRMERISELSEHLFEEQFDEDTVSVDMGDVIELICLISDQLKEISGAKPESSNDE